MPFIDADKETEFAEAGALSGRPVSGPSFEIARCKCTYSVITGAESICDYCEGYSAGYTDG